MDLQTILLAFIAFIIVEHASAVMWMLFTKMERCRYNQVIKSLVRRAEYDGIQGLSYRPPSLWTLWLYKKEKAGKLGLFCWMLRFRDDAILEMHFRKLTKGKTMEELLTDNDELKRRFALALAKKINYFG